MYLLFQSTFMVSAFIDMLVDRCCGFRIGLSHPKNHSYSNSTLSGNRNSQVSDQSSQASKDSRVNEKKLRSVGVIKEYTCTRFLKAVVIMCVEAFEMAVSEKYDRKDWISSGSERSIQDPPSKSAALGGTEDVSHKPYIFWAVTTLKSILQRVRNSELSHPLETIVATLRTLHFSDCDNADYLDELVPHALLMKLVKVANRSVNSSLNFCVFSIWNMMMNQMNRKVITLSALLHNPHAQFQLQVVADSYDASKSLPIVPLLRQLEKVLFDKCYQLCSTLNEAVFPLSSKIGVAGSPYQQLPNGYDHFCTTYKLLRMSSTRLLTESAHYRVNSRFTRELFLLLAEETCLKRSLDDYSTRKHPIEDMSGALHEDIVNFWRTAIAVQNAMRLNSANDVLSEVSSTKATLPDHSSTASSLPTLSIVNVTSTSLHVSWTNVPEDEDWNSAVQRATGQVASTTSGGNLPPNQNTAPTGSALSLSVGGLLASIKGTLSSSQPNHTSFSLYITPVSRAYAKDYSTRDDNSNSEPSKGSTEAEAALVMPFVTPHGSHKIDLLDPGKK